jgi:hypothetical protein
MGEEEKQILRRNHISNILYINISVKHSYQDWKLQKKKKKCRIYKNAFERQTGKIWTPFLELPRRLKLGLRLLC